MGGGVPGRDTEPVLLSPDRMPPRRILIEREGHTLSPKTRSTTDCVDDFEDVTRCGACGTGDSEFLFENFDRWHRLPGMFGLLKCTGCGLVRLSPRPTRAAIGSYYPEEEYYSFGNGPSGVDNPSTVANSLRRGLRDRVRTLFLRELGYGPPLRRAEAWVVRLLRPLELSAKHARRGFPSPSGKQRLLDVGAGAGHFVALMRSYGWEATGVDSSPRAAQQANAAFGVPLMLGNFEERPPSGPFDVVHMSHVVEHFFDPWRALQHAHDVLAPGGRLFVETPNAASISVRRMANRWFPWETPRHLWVFDPATLGDALTRTGFDIISMESYLFDRRYAFEDTFAREEGGSTTSPRPYLRIRRRPRAAILAVLDRIHLAIRPMAGDILTAWAVKPIENDSNRDPLRRKR